MPVPPKGNIWGRCEFHLECGTGNMITYYYEYDENGWHDAGMTKWENYERVK
jgi:hypothetical protein